MQPDPTPQPESLKDLLLLLIERAIRLAAPLLVDAPRTRFSLYHRLVDLLSLATQLNHRLPQLAELLSRRQHRPAPASRPDRPERAERPERSEHVETCGLARPIDVPALVARISRELLAIAKLIGQDAHDELSALTNRAQQAAQSWHRPDPAPNTPRPRPSRPARTLRTDDRHDDPPRKPLPNPPICGQGSG